MRWIFFKVGGTVVSALVTIGFQVLDIAQVASVFGWVFDWRWFTLGSFIVFLIFVAWWTGGLESYKRRTENSKPNIVVRKKDKDEWQFYSKDGQPTYHALQVWFVNNPQVTSDNSVAKDVTAVVTFYDRNTKNKREIYGCFTEAEVPDYATIKDLKDKIDVWSPNDIPQKLLIALKYPGDESAYGYAKSNFLATQDGRESGKEIKKGEHYVKVTLKGIRIDQPPFWFILTNPGREGDLSLSDQIKKPDLCKEGFQTE
jgi:hypothetical protein